MAKKIEVDTKTFIRFWLVIAALGLLLFFIGSALSGLIIVGIAIFLAIAIWPLAKRIDKIDKKKKRPKLSATLAYITVVAVIGLAVAFIGPVVVNEVSRFAGQVPELFETSLGGWEGVNDFGHSIGIDNLQKEITGGVESLVQPLTTNLGATVVSSVGTIAGIVTSTILVLVLTLLLLLEGPGLVEGFWKNLKAGRNEEERRPVLIAERIVNRMAGVISTYVSKQVTVALLDGCVVALAVFILSLIFGFSAGLAIPMGVLAAVFFLIPMFGPIIAAALITLILLISNPVAAIIFLVFYILYEQVENNVIAPKIQGNALKLPPVIILIAITIGIYTLGLPGAIISIPIAGCIKVLYEEWPRLRSHNTEQGTQKTNN